MNYLINRNIVFNGRGDARKSFLRYIVVCAGIMLLSACGTWLLGQTGMSSTVAKLITDFALYFVSFRVQKEWVFKEDVTHE